MNSTCSPNDIKSSYGHAEPVHVPRYSVNCGASNAGFSLVPDVRSSGSTFDYCFNGYNECQSGHRNSGSNTRESEDTSIARIHINIGENCLEVRELTDIQLDFATI